ncbi:LysM peptidoglycan-binding domain-containing protein [Ureibacillus acetophenoni]|uniref:Spore germination protein YaaH n=1 Tax=Ureibacillus acetophenoni TaxID=614649 RepID=A0A285UDP9_9BACL|nr:LysM peptidoglycan-binding domain-containing protein [Ureibacillus acetophenoni]SOC39883.1 spore germination protein YaaH [Ureibacillus acetophenoni]
MTYQFEKVELKTENGEVQIVLHIATPNNEEFGSEFNFKKDNTLENEAKGFVKKYFPKIKVATIVIVTGAVILTTIPLQRAKAHEINFNMSYLYFGNTQSYISQIDKTQGNLNLVSPSYFDINADGSLKITKQFDPVFVNAMHDRGIKVVPFLSNHWDRTVGRAALANREQISTQIADFIIKNNLDGVQVDIENTTEIDREEYTDLVRLLREKIPEGKEVSVAVAPNPSGATRGWQGTYDYNKLAQYASYLMIMAYDESYEGSPEGPVASYPFVEGSIQYALSQGVPAEKIVLGVPFYGRLWKVGGTKSEMGLGISNKRVDELLSRYGGTIDFDERSKTPRATITIREGDPKTTIAGKTLTAGTYHIWYENDASLEAKFDLLHKYNLKGTGSWSLGQEDPDMWKSYRSWLEHEDIEYAKTYTVKSGDTLWKIATANKLTVSKLKEINNLKSDEIKAGQVLYISEPPPTNEQPTIVIPPAIPPQQPNGDTYTVKSGDTLWKIANAFSLSVNELKELNGLTSDEIYIGQVLKVKKTITEPAVYYNPFTDISHLNIQVQNEILNLVDKNIIKGTSATTFSPNQSITRGQVVLMLGRMIVNSGTATVPANWESTQYFRDVPIQTKDRELLKYAAVVNSTNVFLGGTDGALDPSSLITRENMALVLDRATKAINGESLIEIAGGKVGKITDLNEARKDTREAIRALSALGITVNEQYFPKDDVKRSQFASFLTRTMKYLEL